MFPSWDGGASPTETPPIGILGEQSRALLTNDRTPPGSRPGSRGPTRTVPADLSPLHTLLESSYPPPTRLKGTVGRVGVHTGSSRYTRVDVILLSRVPYALY